MIIFIWSRDMWRNILLMSLLVAVPLMPASLWAAEPSQNVKDAVDVIVLMCVAGGEKYEISGTADLDGGLLLRKVGASGRAEVKVSKSEVKGLVDGLNQSLSKIAADQASEARRCMQPYLQRIVDHMLGSGNAVASIPAPSCATNDTFQCAAVLPFGASDSSDFNRRGERTYKFEIQEPTRVKLTLNPMPNSRSVRVTVYTSDYTPVESKSFKPGQPGDFVISLRNAGLYYVILDPAACCTGAPYTYTLSLFR